MERPVSAMHNDNESLAYLDQKQEREREEYYDQETGHDHQHNGAQRGGEAPSIVPIFFPMNFTNRPWLLWRTNTHPASNV